jgi:hypothetical protein
MNVDATRVPVSLIRCDGLSRRRHSLMDNSAYNKNSTTLMQNICLLRRLLHRYSRIKTSVIVYPHNNSNHKEQFYWLILIKLTKTNSFWFKAFNNITYTNSIKIDYSATSFVIENHWRFDCIREIKTTKVIRRMVKSI